MFSFNSSKKRLITIDCPVCGEQYLPAEIFIPDAFLGKPSEIEKTFDGKIDYFNGKSMDTVEEYVCDKCGAKFKVVANVVFKTFEQISKNFTTTYVSPLHTEKVTLFEG